MTRRFAFKMFLCPIKYNIQNVCVRACVLAHARERERERIVLFFKYIATVLFLYL